MIEMVAIIVLIIIWRFNRMKKTVNDIEKLSEGGVKWLKSGLYYIYLPLVLLVGLKTVNWDNFLGPPPQM
jgi:hypothetical protein